MAFKCLLSIFFLINIIIYIINILFNIIYIYIFLYITLLLPTHSFSFFSPFTITPIHAALHTPIHPYSPLFNPPYILLFTLFTPPYTPLFNPPYTPLFTPSYTPLFNPPYTLYTATPRIWWMWCCPPYSASSPKTLVVLVGRLGKTLCTSWLMTCWVNYRKTLLIMKFVLYLSIECFINNINVY